MIRFDNVYKSEDVNICAPNPGFAKMLFDLLKQRTPEESISHNRMPSYESHVDFIYSRPYRYWFLLWSDIYGNYVGTCYLTYNNEIGVQIDSVHRREGFGEEAIKYLISIEGPRHKYFANINPANEKSIKLFEKAGFIHIQNTYRLD